jgi:hypothetical protein
MGHLHLPTPADGMHPFLQLSACAMYNGLSTHLCSRHGCVDVARSAVAPLARECMVKVPSRCMPASGLPSLLNGSWGVEHLPPGVTGPKIDSPRLRAGGVGAPRWSALPQSSRKASVPCANRRRGMVAANAAAAALLTRLSRPQV